MRLVRRCSMSVNFLTYLRPLLQKTRQAGMEKSLGPWLLVLQEVMGNSLNLELSLHLILSWLASKFTNLLLSHVAVVMRLKYNKLFWRLYAIT